MIKVAARSIAGLLFALCLGASARADLPAGVDPGAVPSDHIMMPKRAKSGPVVLISDAGGWSGREQDLARALNKAGRMVIGIDLPAYYANLAATGADCIYTVSDIERLSRQLHRAADLDSFQPPLVAGIGEGATLALAIAAQTPQATIAATIAIDPGAAIPLEKVLCTPAPKEKLAEGTVYGLTPGALPHPIQVVFTPKASDAGEAHVAALVASHPDIALAKTADEPGAALKASIYPMLFKLDEAHGPLDLPLVEIGAEPRYKTMAIIYSGDGGWRDIDQKLAAFFKEDGVPVVGVDALRYFWRERSPKQTAEDLSRIIERYKTRFGVQRVILVGYSFGANILPATYRLLPLEDRKAVSLISLLALSHQADFEIAVSGWLGFSGAGKHGDPVDDLQQIEAHKIQCIYGREEEDSACPALEPLRPAGAEIRVRNGGHHFDGDYRALSDLIVARLKAGE